MVLSISNLEYSYGKKRFLHVSFSLKGGESICLYGHNGSGKSTLLKILSAVVPAESGTIEFLGHNALSKDGYFKKDLRQKIGVLFQGTSTDDKLSSRDNLLYFCQLMGVKNASLKVEQILNDANLIERAHEPVKKLSVGMRRRLEVYRTFLHDPLLLLLDEPTAALDACETSRFFAFLRSYQQRTQASVIMALHNPSEVMHADRVLMMKDGIVIEEGDPKILLSQLNYLQIKIYFADKITKDLSSLNWFDARYDQAANVLSAKFKSSHLLDVLGHPLMVTKAIKSISINYPNMADIYEFSCHSKFPQ